MLVRERQSSGGGRRDDNDPDAARRLLARRGVVGVLVGALIMLLAATALAATGTNLGFLGLASDERPSGGGGLLGGASTGAAADRDELPTTPGSCLTWSAADGSDVSGVACAQPHLFETAGPVQAA